MTRIRVIETEYKGYLFRSRLEARWAVCLDALDIPWRYELEGFELGAYRYLPDFYLPGMALWVEIKGRPPIPAEFVKATLLAQQDKANAVLITWENFEPNTAQDNVLFWHDDNGVLYSQQGWRWLQAPETGWEAAKRARFDNRRGLPWNEWGGTEYGELPY